MNADPWSRSSLNAAAEDADRPAPLPGTPWIDYPSETAPQAAAQPQADPKAARCRQCGGPLSDARAGLGLTLCSGQCHRDAAQPQTDEALRAISALINAAVRDFRRVYPEPHMLAANLALAVQAQKVAADLSARLAEAVQTACQALVERDEARARLAEAERERDATAHEALALSIEVGDRDAALARVRALLDEWETYPDDSEHRVAARWLRAALDGPTDQSAP